MSVWRGNRRRRGWREGASAVEFALLAPLLALVLAGTFELGTYLYQLSALQKSLRAGAMYGARMTFPLSDAATLELSNLVKTGQTAAGGTYLLNGWTDGGASLTPKFRTYTTDGQTVDILRLEASVPYAPLLPGLLDGMGITKMTLTATHEQVRIGS
ncbi:MAG: hypothetical protein FJX68_12450 [Alphaproteobacteria bacterium]|nr:hypothetical protein [Alphaproteobacteria bacterium]